MGELTDSWEYSCVREWRKVTRQELAEMSAAERAAHEERRPRMNPRERATQRRITKRRAKKGYR